MSGKDVEAKELSFQVVKEDWNEYVLDDGTNVRVKASVAKIGRQVDADGNYSVNDYGEPAILVRYALEVVAREASTDANG